MSDEIKRATELWLGAQLKARTAIPFYANKGGEDTAGDAENILPPYGFIMVTAAEKVMEAPAYKLTVKVAYVTHIADATAQQHSAQVRLIQDSLRGLPIGPANDGALIIHGATLMETDDFTDTDEKTHGDVFTLAMGVSQWS